jgi:hypothetical protein
MPRRDQRDELTPSGHMEQQDEGCHCRDRPAGAAQPGLHRQLAAGTYGKDSLASDVTDSLPIPSQTGVLAAMENITFGALS